MTPARRLLLASLAGALAALGFAPWELWPLTLAGIAALFCLIDTARTRRHAFALGWWFGIGHCLVGLSWIATAFTYQAAMPPWLGWVAVGGLAMFLSLYTGLAALIAGSAAPPGPARLLVFAAAWMLTEWLRGHLLSGFAWNPLGEAWLPVPGLPQAAAYVGALGLSGLMVLAGGALVLMPARPTRLFGGGLTAALVVLAAGLAATTPSPRVAANAPLVHLIQPNIGQSNKWDPALENEHLARYLRLSRVAVARSRRLPEAWDREPQTATASPPQLIIWSESSVPMLVDDDPPARAQLANVLRPGDLLLFGGVKLLRDPASRADDPAGEVIAETNSLYVLSADGVLHGRYDKSHLVPLGEYVPARPLMTRLGLAQLAPGAFDFRAGPGPRTLQLPGFPDAGAQICYEMIFPGEVVEAGHRPAWIVNISNDAWFGPSGPPQHLAQARLRAIEEGLPVARATPTGISAVIDARGRIVRELGQGVAGIVTTPLPPPLPPTWFSRWAHWTTLVFGAALLAGAAAARPKRRVGATATAI